MNDDYTVCICVRDGAAHVDRCLSAVFADGGERRSLVVIDHASHDATPALLASWQAREPQRLRVIRFDGEGLSAARNVAWRAARTPWVAFLDIDCGVRRGWCEAVGEVIAGHDGEPRTAAIGGANEVLEDGGWMARACAVFLPTYVGGHGSVQNRPIATARRVEHCPTLNVVYRRSALEAVGGFDERYTRVAEDLALSRRLRRAGYSMWVDPRLVVAHAPRATLSAWLRNMFLYGRGRTFDFKQAPEELEPKFLAPAFMVLVYLGVVACEGASAALALLAGVHVGLIAFALVPATRRKGERCTAWLLATLIVWLTHLSYGAGLLFEVPRRGDRFVP